MGRALRCPFDRFFIHIPHIAASIRLPKPCCSAYGAPMKGKNNRNADISGLDARRAALRLLDAVLRMGTPMDQAATGICHGLQPSDRALTIAIVQEVLRWMPDLDQLIDGCTRQNLPGDAKARTVLRLALAQILRLGTPPHAVIATALPLLAGGPRKLVHGILGNIIRSGAALPELPALPDHVMLRWMEAWGEEMAEGARTALASPPPLDINLRNPDETAIWAERLEGVSLMPGHVRLSRGSAVEELPGFADGDWWVQDLAAQIPARLLGPGKGRTVIDLCAAPGGKSMQLAAQGWNVIAVDSSERRMKRLSENLTRTGLPARCVTANILKWQPDEPVDAILLDAPCTATGTLRRHPDVLHRIGGRQIAELAELQRDMLDHIAGWTKADGQLVYATCSLEPEEGERQIEGFLTRHGEYRAATGEHALPDAINPDGRGFIRTRPPMLAAQGGLDGFFIAHLVRHG